MSLLLSACALNDADYFGNTGVSYVGGYYEPFGYDCQREAARDGQYRPNPPDLPTA
jgi:hypothetical protein